MAMIDQDDQEAAHADAGHGHRAHAEPGEAVGQQAPGQETHAHAGAGGQQAGGDGGAIQAGDIAQPGAGPEADDGHGAAGGERAQRRDAPEEAVAEDLAEAAQLIAQAQVARRFPVVGHDEEHGQRHHQRERRQAGEQDAPVGHPQEPFHRHGGADRAEGAAGHEAGVGQRQALRREPHGEGLERGHHAAGDADADQRAPEGETGEVLRQRERQRTGRGQRQQHGLDAARAETVEGDAQRQLQEGEGAHVGGGEEAQLVGGDAGVGDQVGRGDGVDRAEQVRTGSSRPRTGGTGAGSRPAGSRGGASGVGSCSGAWWATWDSSCKAGSVARWFRESVGGGRRRAFYWIAASPSAPRDDGTGCGVLCGLGPSAGICAARGATQTPAYGPGSPRRFLPRRFAPRSDG
ncbi:MAG: hypothetical protein U5K33_07105 [Halofilum sp. (in: g-proteobacteria)]|nr:hypothetical protein [Halofilum sp. (in: g-proteobacteria)]